jgi:hypothetical protein
MDIECKISGYNENSPGGDPQEKLLAVSSQINNYTIHS